MVDATTYGSKGQDLASVMSDRAARDDLMAMILAAKRLPHVDVRRWVPQAGPLPTERKERDALISIADRGMKEVGAYLATLGLL